MSFVDAYAAVRPCVVAIVRDLQEVIEEKKVRLPSIIGTGFAVRADGWVATAGHVVAAAEEAKEKGGQPGVGLFIQVQSPRGTVAAVLVRSVMHFVDYSHGPGEDPPDSPVSEPNPDLGLLRIPIRGLPVCPLEPSGLPEGAPVAVAGFPLGEALLARRGALGHLGPTVRAGIVSARLISPEGHANAGYLYDIQNQGGSSGAPVFGIGGGVIAVHSEEQPDYSRSHLMFGADGRIAPRHGHAGLSVGVSKRLLAQRLLTLDKDVSASPDREWDSHDTLQEALRDRAAQGGLSPELVVARSQGGSLLDLDTFKPPSG